ncbi:hypothetical protein Tco_1524734 [Tanacetum coccineum]
MVPFRNEILSHDGDEDRLWLIMVNVRGKDVLVKVFDFGALVMYKWIARHYVREIISNPKISHRELQDAIREKFLINVNLGQVRRAKQRALYDFEGWVVKPTSKGSMSASKMDGLRVAEKVMVGWVGFLKGDNSMVEGATVTIISRWTHKVFSCREWLPLAEHRQCARHIYANLKKSWPGLHFKSLFWGAASATLKHVFDEKMKLLSNLNEHAHKWLVERDPNTWSNAFFHMDRSCGAFENGICESYHAAIINQRARGLTDIITPSVRKQLEKLKEYLRLWEVYPSGYREFEDLTGIPCIHGVAAYAYVMKDPAEGVSDFYSKIAWQNCYISFIKPVSGQSMWGQKQGLSTSNAS